MGFDPTKYGAKKVENNSGGFDPSKYGATVVAEEEPKKKVGTTDSSTGGTPIFSQFPSNSEAPSSFSTAGGNTKPTTTTLQPLETPKRIDNPSFSNLLNTPDLLDHDIAANSTFSLSNINNAPKDPASLQGFNQSQQSLASGSILPSASEEATHKAREIKTNPDALRGYRKTRMDELDAQINQLQASKQPTVSYLETGQRLSQEVQPVDLQIDELKKYKDNLQKSVATAALVSVPKQVLDGNKNFNIEDIGKKYLETIGDPTVTSDEKVLNTTAGQLNPKGDTNFGKVGQYFSGSDELANEQGVMDLTKQTIRNKLFQQGATALSAYHLAEAEKIADSRSAKVSAFLELKKGTSEYNTAIADPDIKEYVDNATKALHYNEEANTSAKYYPQVQRQQLRQTLNDKFFDLVTKRDENTNKLSLITPLKLAGQAIFGETPTESDVAQLAKETGKPIEEVKNIVNTPVSGVFATAPQGVRVGGLATGVSQAVDETLGASINGLRRIFNVDNVDAKNALTQTRSDAYNMQGGGNTLYDQYGTLNFNPYSVSNMAGRGVGQMAVFALPSMVTGGLAEGLAGEGLLAAAAKKSVPALTTIASGYVGSYEPAYKEISAHTDNEEARRGYANYIALANAIPELFLSPAEIAGKIGIGKPTKEALIKTFINDTEKLGADAAFSSRLISGAKAAGEVVAGENIEELATNVATNKADEVYLDKVRTGKELADQFTQTLVSTTINMLPMMIGAGVSGTHDAGGLRRHAIMEAGSNSEETLAALKQQLDAGAIQPEQYNTKVSIVHQLANIVSNLPKENIHGEPLDYEQKAKLAAAQYRIDLNKKLEEKTRGEGAVAAQADLIKADTESAISEQKDILTQPIINATESTANGGEAQGFTQEGSAQQSNEGTATQEIPAQTSTKGATISDAEIKPTFEKVAPHILSDEEKGTVQGVVDRVNNADNVNENEINAAANVLYDTWDKAPEARHLIEPLINKLENYEFTTTTKTRNITETVPVEVARNTKPKEVIPALEQSAGSPVTVTSPFGAITEGTLAIKDGRYVLTNDGENDVVIGDKSVTDVNLTLPSEEKMANPIEFDENGAVSAVTFQTNKGDLVRVENPETALDLAIQLRADAVGEVEEPLFDTVFQEVQKQVQEEVLKNQPNESKKESPNVIQPKADEGATVVNEPQSTKKSSDTKGTIIEDTQVSKQASVTSKTPSDAVQISSPTEVLQRQSEETGKTGSERSGVEQQQQGQETTKPSEKKAKVSRTKASATLRTIADRVEKNGVLPSWAKATLPEGTQVQGFDSAGLSKAVSAALRISADAIDNLADLADAVDEGFNHLMDYYRSNNVAVDEDALKKGFEQEVKNGVSQARRAQQQTKAKRTTNKSQNKSHANFTVRMATLMNDHKDLTPEQIIATQRNLTQEQKDIIYEQYAKRKSKEEAGLEDTKRWVGELFDAVANGKEISKSAFNIAKSDFAHILDLVSDKFIEYKVVSNRKLEKFADKAIELFKDDYVGAIDYINNSNRLKESKPILLAKLAVKLDEAGKGKLAAKVIGELIDTSTITARTLQSFRRVNEILNVKGSPQYKTELAKKIMNKAQEMSNVHVDDAKQEFERQLNNNKDEIKKYKEQLDAIRNKAHKSALSGIKEKMEDLLNKICNTRRK